MVDLGWPVVTVFAFYFFGNFVVLLVPPSAWRYRIARARCARGPHAQSTNFLCPSTTTTPEQTTTSKQPNKRGRQRFQEHATGKKNDNCSKFFTGIEGWLFLLVKQQHEHLDPQQRAVPVSVRNHHSCCELLPPNSSETLLGKSVRCSAISR